MFTNTPGTLDHCSNWTTNSSAINGEIGTTGSTNFYRWGGQTTACNQKIGLVCIVN